MRVIGVEPEAGDDTQRSLAQGERVALPVPRTIADGLQATDAGRADLRGQPAARRRGRHGHATRELVDAMRFAFDRLKLVIEPSGAAGLAALLRGAIPERRAARRGRDLRRNVGAARFAELISPP